MLRGVPFNATEQKIAEFFGEYNVSYITTIFSVSIGRIYRLILGGMFPLRSHKTAS